MRFYKLAICMALALWAPTAAPQIPQPPSFPQFQPPPPEPPVTLGSNNPCTFAPRVWDTAPTSSNLTGKWFTEPARQANRFQPFTATFSSRSPVELTLMAEQSRRRIARARLRVEHLAYDVATTFCETGWVDPTAFPPFHHVLLPHSGDGRWRVVVDQDIDPTALLNDGDYVQIDIKGEDIVNGIGFEPTMLLPQYIQSVATCAIDELPTRFVKPLPSQTIAPGSFRSSLLLFAQSGRHLFVKLDRPAAVTLTFSSKYRGSDQPFQPVCKLDLPKSASSEMWVRAETPWTHSDLQDWRIEVTAQEEILEPIAISLRGNEEYYGGRVPGITKPAAYQCVALRPGMRSYPPVDPSRANLTAYALSLDIDYRGREVRADVRDAVARSLLTALSTWRSLCRHCSPYHFIVVSIDGQIYAIDGLMLGEPGAYKATLQRPSPFGDSEMTLGASKTARGGTAGEYAPYVIDEKQRASFCAQAPEKKYRFSAADSPLCRPTTRNSKDELRIKLIARDGQLNCDGRKQTVACFNGSLTIEFNARDYSFYVDDLLNPVFGVGDNWVDLTRVFSHEAGHWLGLQHIASDEGIMSDSYVNARCVDGAALDALAVVALGQVPSMAPRRESLVYADEPKRAAGELDPTPMMEAAVLYWPNVSVSASMMAVALWLQVSG